MNYRVTVSKCSLIFVVGNKRVTVLVSHEALLADSELLLGIPPVI